ncbi:saccharopine dehydrogenase family protein [Oceanobacillus sp. CAU 1775]
MKLLVIGGAGHMAGAALEKIVADDYFDEVIVADYNLEAAEKKVAEIGNKKYRAAQVDVFNKEQLVGLMNQVDVVASGAGPFYRLLNPVIEALFDSTCKNYVDICDDISAINEVMTEENQKRAKEQGMRIIIGLGGSPGLIPVEVMHAASMMDDVHTAGLYMVMDELVEGGPAVWDHMYENFNGTIEVFEDGELKEVEGLTREEYYDYPEEIFGDLGRVKVYDLGHPEVHTLPQALPNIKNIPIKVTIYPIEAMDLIKDFNAQGLLNTEEIEVDGKKVSPRNVLLELTKETQLNPDYKGGLHDSYRGPNEVVTGSIIEVHGTKDGKPVMYISGFSTPMGPVTGYPMAVGARMLAEGEIEETGIMIPEIAISNPGKLVNEVFDSIKKTEHFLRRFARVTYDLNS